MPSILVPLEQQALRFARLFLFALVVQLTAVGHLDRSAAIAAIVAAAEVAFKEMNAQVKARHLAKNNVLN